MADETIINPNTLIAGNLCDLNPPLGGTIEYYTNGFAPNRQLIVNFNNIQHFPSGNPITMQYILFETTNVIQIHHTTFAATTTATEGIEDATGTNFLVVPGRNNALWGANNEAWQFSPGATTYNYSWSPTIGLSNPNIANPVASPTSSTLYTVTATDTNGCTGTAQISLLVTNLPVTVTASPDTVCAGSTSQLVATATSNSTTNYTVSTIPFSPITGTGSPVMLADDQVSGMLPIGFTFGFYGNYYTQFNIGSNGFITFDAAASANNYQGCCSGQILPNAGFPNNLIAGAWEDLNASLGGGISYFVSGTFPNRILVVNFNAIPHSPNVNPVTFQIQLYETSNVIEIHTTTMPGNPGGYWWGHTQGIENATGTAAVFPTGRNHNSTWTATNDGVRFSPVNTFTYIWSPSGTLSSSTIFNPVATPVGTTTYTVNLTDVNGCVGSGSVAVYSNPLPSIPVVSYPGLTLYSTYGSGNQWYLNGVLIPGATLQTFIPWQVGIYTVTYTDGNGCSATSLPFEVTVIGIDEYLMNVNVSVFPNPATEKLTVTIDNNQPAEITIYDVTSRIIFHQKFTSSNSIITTSFAKGMCLYEIKCLDKLTMTNAVVKKGRLVME